MLTRLQVSGFKNLQGIDLRLGPFTCIFGGNGVGKSNLFDAIAFLSALADKPLAEAAASIRGTEGRTGDVRSLFRVSGGERAEQMRFVAEMLVPASGMDDLGSLAVAGTTFLRYEIVLRLREAGPSAQAGPLEVVREELNYINRSKAKHELWFPHSRSWRDSVVLGRRSTPYIQTARLTEPERTVVYSRADSPGGKGGGRPRTLLAANMPRTLLSAANNAEEHRTLVLARKEMMGWAQFQLEPSALRAPDAFTAPRMVSPSGAHLPAALRALADAADKRGEGGTSVYARISNRLARLSQNVRGLQVDEDAARELLSVVLTDLDDAQHRASSLSDGTLRFLALAVLNEGDQGPPLMCLEEPENGVHPDRIEDMLRLLQDIAVEPNEPVSSDNPLRQVIVNTHSPAVVNSVPEDALVGAILQTRVSGGRSTQELALRCLPGTWREGKRDGLGMPSEGALVAILGHVQPRSRDPRAAPNQRRVMDRPDIRELSRQVSMFPTGDDE